MRSLYKDYIVLGKRQEWQMKKQANKQQQKNKTKNPTNSMKRSLIKQNKSFYQIFIYIHYLNNYIYFLISHSSGIPSEKHIEKPV